MTRGLAPALAILLGFAPCAMGGPASPESPARSAAVVSAVERATRESKPIVLFSGADRCPPSKKAPDPCRMLEAAVKHPAIQRRLARVVYVNVKSDDAVATLAVLDPGGRPVVRWAVPPDTSSFREMLTLVDGASQYIESAYRARAAGDATGAAREECLATLALGDATLGRTRLLALRASENREASELATIWLAWLGARMDGAPLDETPLVALATSGATNRVRFEAWMTLGESRLAGGRTLDSTAAFRAALDLAPDSGPEREVAHAALARSAEAASPVIGLGPPGSIVAGLRTIQPKWNEARAASVEYRLDGRLVATGRNSPFAAQLQFGRIPTRRLLEISARDKKGDIVRSASVVVNDGSGAFGIQIVEPAGETLSGAADVELMLRVPRGRTVDEAVIEWNGSVLARLEAPPWHAMIDADGASFGLLRAVVRLDDGQEREDVRLFNTGDLLLDTGVHLVELPVYAASRELKAGEFVVKEAGVVRPVDRVIPASEAPLEVALLLDMSTSMRKDVLDLEEAALQFVENGLGERARVTVVAFDTTARVAIWPTSDREPIERAIQNLHVRGATALYDALITATLQLQSSGSRRAIVVLSDGVDNVSTFSLSDAREVAKRSAVPIYFVALNPVTYASRLRNVATAPPPEQLAQQRLGILARSSGGIAFELDSIERAGPIWKTIADDLRNQSLLIYRTGDGKAGWRELSVSLKKGGRLRAPEGVYVEDGGPAENETK
ncbi:MAG: VWA domain-containing protein [Thermoanaerobaculia bacterium]